MMIAHGAAGLVIDAVDVRVLPSKLSQGLTLKNMQITGCRDLPVVQVAAGALRGYGESPPLPTFTGLDAQATADGLRQACERIIGREASAALEALHSEPRLPGPVRCALDIALHDLIAHSIRVPVDRLLGTRQQQSVPISRALGFHPPSDLAELVKQYRSLGVNAFKVKVGRDLRTDLQAIEVVRRSTGPECEISIDANESLSREDAVALARAAKGLGVAYFEQPVVRTDLDGLRAVREAGMPVMADESVFSASDVARLSEAGAVDLIAIKLIKCGGLAPAIEIVRAGHAYGLPVTVIDPLGSAISLHAGLAVALTIEPHQYAHGLSAGFDVDSPFAPHEQLEGGRLSPRDASGLGIDVTWPAQTERL